MLGLETALAVAFAELHRPPGTARAPTGTPGGPGTWRPAASSACQLAARPPSPALGRDDASGGQRAGGPIDPGAAGQPVRVRPGRRLDGRPAPRWPAAAATPRTPGGELTGRVRHTVLRGEPVVVDGEPQR